MNPRRTSLALAASLALLAPVAAVLAQSAAAADKWHKVAISGNEIAFVNTSSIQRVGTQLQVRVKQNYLAPVDSAKKGKTYQSARTDYRLDCEQRKLAMMATRAFASPDLQGDVVQKASRSEKNLIWVDAPRASVFGEILDYGCKNAPAG
jgi:opacity protein-like surface antigen